MTGDAIGGVWQYCLELARGLERHDVEVLLAVMGGGITPTKRAEVAALPNVRLVEDACQLEWMDSPWDDVAAAGQWLLHLAEQFSPCTVHLNGYSHAALPWNAPVVVVAHSCVLSWFRSVRGQAAPDSWNTYRTSVGRGLQAADLIVSPSRAMLNNLGFDYGHLADTRVILNGRDADSYHPGPKENLILSAGRLWDDAKNFQVLSDAAPNVKWPIYVAGASKHPTGAASTFTGLSPLGSLPSAELAAWYSRAAIYALPALYEPFGLTVLEAALSSCALVLSDIPSLREIWGDAALYVNPREHAAWSDQLNLLALDTNRRTTLATAALERGRELTAAKMTLEYLEAYRQARLNRQCASHSSVIPSDPIGITEMPTSYAA